MKTVRFLRPAEIEILDAARYYELQSAGLGTDFLERVQSAVHDIGANPETWPVVRPDIRRRLIHRFPYCLLYRSEAQEIVVLATMHLHRHPDYWLNRP